MEIGVELRPRPVGGWSRPMGRKEKGKQRFFNGRGDGGSKETTEGPEGYHGGIGAGHKAMLLHTQRFSCKTPGDFGP